MSWYVIVERNWLLQPSFDFMTPLGVEDFTDPRDLSDKTSPRRSPLWTSHVEGAARFETREAALRVVGPEHERVDIKILDEDEVIARMLTR